MDELWQRYRGFWTPVLIGLGVFLVGLIVVHILTENPETLKLDVVSERSALTKKKEPKSSKITNLRANRNLLKERSEDWARRIDQAELAQPREKVVAAVVTQALQAALLRGLEPAELRAAIENPEGGTAATAALARFDGDTTAAGKALARYEQVRQERLNSLLAGDPNVGFSSLVIDVGRALGVRANRADVELKSDMMGFGGVTSVTQSVLAQRLLNLALIAEIMDLAIRSHARAILDVRLENRNNPLGDDVFLREWPFTFTVQGDITAIRPILARLTDPERPITLTQLTLSQPPRGKPEEGLVQLQATAASVLVRPDASLDLDTEDQ